MSNTHIEMVESGFEKADNYRYQMGRYNLAIQHEFYFEAIVIAYAMIEDRLLAFLHYAGVIDRRQQSDQTEHGIYVSAQCQKQINVLLKRNNNQIINLNTINIKIKIIKNLMKLPESNNDQYLDLVRAQIDRMINRNEFNALIQKLNTWLPLRNQIIHALMGKQTKEVLARQACIADERLTIGRAIDGFVSKLKNGNSDGIRIPNTEE
ncbi:MAG: hypothetical protein IIY06_04035 [Proteobacteria bacterium]|nr:hypothetical protein [Pseudomonadota bacterium]